MWTLPWKMFSAAASGPFRSDVGWIPSHGRKINSHPGISKRQPPMINWRSPFLGCSSVDVWQAQQHERRKTFGHENVVKVHRCTVIKMFSNKKVYRRTKAKSSKKGRDLYFFIGLNTFFVSIDGQLVLCISLWELLIWGWQIINHLSWKFFNLFASTFLGRAPNHRSRLNSLHSPFSVSASLKRYKECHTTAHRGSEEEAKEREMLFIQNASSILWAQIKYVCWVTYEKDGKRKKNKIVEKIFIYEALTQKFRGAIWHRNRSLDDIQEKYFPFEKKANDSNENSPTWCHR